MNYRNLLKNYLDLINEKGQKSYFIKEVGEYLQIEEHHIRVRAVVFHNPGDSIQDSCRKLILNLMEVGLNSFFKFTKASDISNVLEEANVLVNKDRNAYYGDPVDTYNKVGTIASVITGKHIEGKDIIKIFIATKLVRESYKHKRDNLVDVCGYSEILNRFEKVPDEY